MSLDPVALAAQMTLKGKAALCTGATTWTTTPDARVDELLTQVHSR